jgi:hypothetical protein
MSTSDRKMPDETDYCLVDGCMRERSLGSSACSKSHARALDGVPIIHTDGNGRPFDRPDREDFGSDTDGLIEYWREVWAYKNRIAACRQEAFDKALTQAMKPTRARSSARSKSACGAVEDGSTHGRVARPKVSRRAAAVPAPGTPEAIIGSLVAGRAPRKRTTQPRRNRELEIELEDVEGHRTPKDSG